MNLYYRFFFQFDFYIRFIVGINCCYSIIILIHYYYYLYLYYDNIAKLYRLATEEKGNTNYISKQNQKHASAKTKRMTRKYIESKYLKWKTNQSCLIINYERLIARKFQEFQVKRELWTPTHQLSCNNKSHQIIMRYVAAHKLCSAFCGKIWAEKIEIRDAVTERNTRLLFLICYI